MSALRATLVRSFAGLLELLGPWRDAFDAVADRHAISAAPDWCYGLWFQHSGIAEIEVLAIWRGDALALVFPYRVERAAFRQLGLTGLLEIEPVFAAEDDAEVFDYWLATLRRLHRDAAIQLHHIDLAYASARAVVAAVRRASRRLLMEKSHDNVMISLVGGFEVFRAGLSGNTREGLRKAQSRLTKHARSHRYVTATTPAEVSRAVDLALAVDSRSWKVGRGGAMCVTTREDVMFKCALERMAHQRRARVYVLEIDHRPAAFILGAVVGRTRVLVDLDTR